MKISIIIPVYKVSAYIERCLQSVMNQTYSGFECILVDDASPDDSMAIAERMIADYQGNIRFKVVHHEKNRGLSAARNTGTDAATGDYILYIDSDDEITVDCIEKLLRPVMEDGTIEMVQGNHVEEREGLETIYNKGSNPLRISTNQEVSKQLFKHHHIFGSAWNKLLKRSFAERCQLIFKEGLLFEDKLWMFYMQKHLEHVYICNDVTYYYHVRPDSITTCADGRAVGESNLQIYQEILNNLTPGREQQELSGYVYGFCKPYCLYLDRVPELKDVYQLYLNQAGRFGCWYVCLILNVVGMLRKMGNPMGVLKWLHAIRWKLT